MSAGIAILLTGTALGGFALYEGPIRKALLRKKLTASTVGSVAFRGGTIDPANIYIGPWLCKELGGTKSPGCPLHPRPIADGTPGFEIDVPVRAIGTPFGDGVPKLDSFGFNHGPLTEMQWIEMELWVDPSEPDAQFLAVPEEDPSGIWPVRGTMWMQRALDDWSDSGIYEEFRWYYTAELFYLKPGLNVIRIPLDKGWTGCQFSTLNPDDKGGVNPDGSFKPKYNPEGFQKTKDQCLAVWFGLGGNEVGTVHGGAGTKPIKVRCTKWKVY